MTTLLPAQATGHLKAAFVHVKLAPLTSVNNPHPTLSVSVSLAEKASWPQGYIENSRHGLFFVHQRADGRAKVECLVRFFKLPKFRAVTVGSTEKALAKIQAWLDLAAQVPTTDLN